ncbi:hypothetical protein LCGC14_0651590 [marine sediment metagenome]|uniref:DNA methylase N-4/N-6 domain-containing protein n=1 Tax=marine sediment metagenome TaxID=412755 RepID=A0A0F9RFZ6_9ZZZZ
MTETKRKTWAVCDAKYVGSLWSELCVDLVLTSPPYYSPNYMSADPWVEMVTAGLLSAGSILNKGGVMAIILNEIGHEGQHRKVIANLQEHGYLLFGEDVWFHGGNLGDDEYDPIFYLSRGYGGHRPRRVHPHRAPPHAWIVINPSCAKKKVTLFGTLHVDLVYSVIDQFTRPGHLILDPFCGTGVISKVGAEMGRICYGSDIYFEVVEYARIHS